MEHDYTITGMTCEGCKAKVKNTLEALPEIKSAEIDLKSGRTKLNMSSHISLEKLQNTLSAKGKYTIQEDSKPKLQEEPEQNQSFFQVYKPLLLIVAFIAGVSGLAQGFSSFSFMLWMRYFMAGFFIVFSFFKLLNLNGFASSYKMYDIVAANWKFWGYIYPFVELALGIAYLVHWNPLATNIATVLVLGISTIGVVKSNLDKRKIKCACLGDVFNLPMSKVTIIEDVSMVLMAIVMLTL